MRIWGFTLCVCVGVGCGDDSSNGTGVVSTGASGLTMGSTSSATSTGTSTGESSTAPSTTGDAAGTSNATTETEGSSSSTGDGDESTSASPTGDDGSTGAEARPDPLWVSANLWYSTEDRLNYIEIDPSDGTVVQLVTSTITTPMIDGQTGITMLESGGLLLSRESAMATEIYYVEDPPTEASEIEVEVLGTVPDMLRIEALYTDCEGLVYLMDTGTDVVNTDGNRLIRFTGDYLSGDLSYEVITDLSIGSAPDIDDLGPGLDDDDELTDGQGFAIDSGTVYDFNYNTGTGVSLGNAGTYGVHVLGGPLFDDGQPRLYIFDVAARLYEANPDTLTLSELLVTGPASTGGTAAGLSGITGPLTECVSTLPPPG